MGLYRVGFNGKENDNEVKGDGNQQDYGFRIYDPRVGRFLSVDPLAKSYPELTPYQFGSNRPIDGIDLDGLEYSPAGKGNGVGVPRDNTAVQLYPIHPGNLDKQIAEAPLREKFKLLRNHALGTKSDASVGATPNLGYYGNKLHEERSAELFKQAGWNADGSEPAWHKLADNKTFSNFSQNIGIPIAEMAAGEGVAKFAFSGIATMIRPIPKLVGYGGDDAIATNLGNLTSKRGWYDVVVHGTEDGLGFTIDRSFVTPEQLYSRMLTSGYTPGTKIRLMSCYSGALPNGAAFQISKLAGADVMAPSGALYIAPKGSFMVNYGQQFYIESSALHETGKMFLFKR